jgi:SH3-like domain-containing protein
MAYLSGGEKFILGILVAFLVVVGLITLRSQINYGSPVAIFSDIIQRQNSKPVPQQKEEAVLNTTNATVSQDVNFRTEASSNNTPIGVLKPGTKVNVISIENGWARIIDNNGTEGYVSNEFLQY